MEVAAVTTLNLVTTFDNAGNHIQEALFATVWPEPGIGAVEDEFAEAVVAKAWHPAPVVAQEAIIEVERFFIILDDVKIAWVLREPARGGPAPCSIDGIE
jgi:hypothetical protein